MPRIFFLGVVFLGGLSAQTAPDAQPPIAESAVSPAADPQSRGPQTADPQPLDWRERWDNYVDRTYNWRKITLVAAESAFDQTFNLRKCGRPPYCFPHHIGGSLVRRTTRTSIELVAGELFREDIRRRPSGLTGFRRRAVYALLHAPLARSADGEWRPAYSRFAGTLGGIAVWSAWDGRPMTTGRLATHFAWSATSYFQDSLFTEFEPDMKRLAKHFSKHLWQRFH